MRTNGMQGRPHQWQRQGGCSGNERGVGGDTELSGITASGACESEP
jgi:hypothetical protein